MRDQRPGPYFLGWTLVEVASVPLSTVHPARPGSGMGREAALTCCFPGWGNEASFHKSRLSWVVCAGCSWVCPSWFHSRGNRALRYLGFEGPGLGGLWVSSCSASCAVTPKIFSALSELEDGVPEVGQCVLLLHSDFLGNLSSHSDPLSLFHQTNEGEHRCLKSS